MPEIIGYSEGSAVLLAIIILIVSELLVAKFTQTSHTATKQYYVYQLMFVYPAETFTSILACVILTSFMS